MVTSAPRDGDRPQRQHVGRVQPLDVASHQVGLLDRQERREDPGHVTAPLQNLTETAVHRGHRLIDRHLLEIVVLPHVHRGQQPRVIGGLVAVPALVADPVVVDVRIGPRLEPPEPPLVLLGADVAAGRATGADRVVLGEEPDALLVQEVLVQQRPDRADVDDVTGQRVGVQGMAREDVDLGMVTPRITSSSPVWVISRVNRTHRVHMMQRSWLSWIRSETSLRGLTSRSSTNRWLAWP